MEMIHLFHDGMKATVCVRDVQSNEILINHGTKQGCILVSKPFHALSISPSYEDEK